MQRYHVNGAAVVRVCSVLAVTVPTVLSIDGARAEQPPSPCHPNPNAEADRNTVATRGDVKNLPKPLQDRLIRLADRPHTYLPMQAFAEARNDDGSPKPSQLFQYYLLDTTGGFPPNVGFEANVFTSRITGVNDHAQLTVTGANCGLQTIGTVRVVLEPKPGLPTDPEDPRAFVDIFTDISPMFVINNESGWYEGWMLHDITVPEVAPPRPDGHAQFGKITKRDAEILGKMGTHTQQCAGEHLYPRRRGPTLPRRNRPLPRQADERRSNSCKHGRLQRHAAVGCALLLGVQLYRDELGSPAL
jgi:hypothetical protein